MFRGTTPTLNFTLPFNCSEITKCNIAISQAQQLVIDKSLTACTTSGKVLSCCLTEEETLSLDCHKPCEIQLRIYCGSTKLASKIWTVPVGRILKEGVFINVVRF